MRVVRAQDHSAVAVRSKTPQKFLIKIKKRKQKKNKNQTEKSPARVHVNSRERIVQKKSVRLVGLRKHTIPGKSEKEKNETIFLHCSCKSNSCALSSAERPSSLSNHLSE